jgi:MarR family transcriptional regulator, organic hydroperoxide resistance regulator
MTSHATDHATDHASAHATANALDLCLHISLAHASLALKLDDLLGTFHGLSFSDFILLRLLNDAEGGRLAVTDLRRPMGLQGSAVTRELVRLEKMGLVQRETAADPGRRMAMIRPIGQRLLNEALGNAEAVCADALRGLSLQARSQVDAALSMLCASPALTV